MPVCSDKTTKTLKNHIIKFNNASVYFGDLVALKDITFTIDKGDFLYIIGPNGAGKTTLVKLLAGLIKPSTGTVVRCDQICGYLPQMHPQKQNFPITVNEVIYSGFLNQKLIMPNEAKKVINDWLIKMEIGNLGKKLIATLSGGQLQRVLLIRALITNPDLLILDEPTSALDPDFRDYFYELIEKIHQQGTTILFITHDLHKPLNHQAKILEIDQVIKFYGSIEQYRKTGGHHV